MRDEGFREFVEDQLSNLDVTIHRMFGGYGIYQGPIFFGIIHAGQLFFKTDLSTRSAYADRGMKPFQPSAKQTLKTYYEVPADILESIEALEGWASASIACDRPSRGGKAREVTDPSSMV